MKLGIVVGHNSAKQGAVRVDTGESEYSYNSRIAERMMRLARTSHIPNLDARVFYRQAGMGFRAEIEKVYAETDAWGADLTMELHFNGSENPDVSGTEVLSSGTRLSLLAAHEVQEELIQLLDLEDRGVKTRARHERGGRSLFSGRAPAILVEPFFGSSPIGTSKTDEEHEEEMLAKSYLFGAATALSQFPNSGIVASALMQSPAIEDDQGEVKQLTPEEEHFLARIMRRFGFVRVEEVDL